MFLSLISPSLKSHSLKSDSFMLSRLPHHQRGSLLLTAIFAMIVLGGLSIALLKINAGQQSITSREVLGARAWFAASSGNEWAMTQLFPLVTNETLSPKTTCGFANLVPATGIDFTATGLKGCKVFVSCKLKMEGLMSQYYVESKGECGTGEFKVVRVQELWARDV